MLLHDALYYRTIEGILLKCLDVEETEIALAEINEGFNGNHQSAYKMKWILRRAGYY
jgi:hypothetical protein